MCHHFAKHLVILLELILPLAKLSKTLKTRTCFKDSLEKGLNPDFITQHIHGELVTVLCYHPYLVSMLFADLLSLHLCYIFNVFYSCSCYFFSSRCMLDLKFAIYYRAASLPAHA